MERELWEVVSAALKRVARAFGNVGSFGGGLGPLPNWVRRLGRVTRWVWCKLMTNAARIIRRRNDL